MKNQLLVYSQSNPQITDAVVTYQLTMTFGDTLRVELNKRDMTAAELSRRSGVTKQHLHKILNNEQSPMTGAVTKPSVDTVDKIAKGLHWDIDEARLAAGYAPLKAFNRPQTAADFIEALEALGIERISLHENLDELTPDDLAALLRDVSMVVEMNVRRALTMKAEPGQYNVSIQPFANVRESDELKTIHRPLENAKPTPVKNRKAS